MGEKLFLYINTTKISLPISFFDQQRDSCHFDRALNERISFVKAIRILNQIRHRRIYEVFRTGEYRQVNPALWRRRLREL